MVNKWVWNAVFGCNLKNDRTISVRFRGKPFNITVIQVYAPTSNAEEAEVERFYEDLQDLLELTPKKDVLFTVYMYTRYHIFFIRSSVDGQSGCFHVPAIVNRAAMNSGVYVSLQLMVFSGFMTRWSIFSYVSLQSGSPLPLGVC